MVIDRIVVAIGEQANGRDVLDWALTHSAGRSLLLVRVVGDTGPLDDATLGGDVVDAAQRSLEDLAATARSRKPGVAIESALVRGDPVTELVRLSGRTTLLVLGTTPRHGSTYRYAFSVATKVATRASGPVAIIPAGSGDDHRSTEVVVGIDGSPASAAAVLLAAEEALVIGGALRAVHIWQEPLIWQDTYAPEEEFLDSLEASHRAILDDALLDVRARYPELVIIRDLVHGSAAGALLDAARDAAMLVVGNHTRSVVGRLLLGSVSHSVVLGITTPTIVVHDDPR